MTAKDIQEKVLKETGMKTSVRKNTGSMKGYVCIWPIYQGNQYPKFPFEFVQNMKEYLSEFDYGNYPLFVTTSEIQVYGISDERTNHKKEKKDKPISEKKDGKGWGSKNSQLRLDKATARYAKRLRKGGCARYY